MLRNDKPWADIIQAESAGTAAAEAVHPSPEPEPDTGADMQEWNADDRQEDRRIDERRTEERRSGERRRRERRDADALRSQVQWTVTQDKKLNSVRQRFGDRFKIRPSRIFLLALALISGGVAAYMATHRDEPVAAPQPKPAVEIAQPKTTAVLVARAAIAPGQKLTAAALGWQDWPDASVQSDYVSRKAEPEAVADMAGALVREAFRPGEPIRADKLVRGHQGYLATVLDAGMRAVSVLVSSASASGGFISPGDHVDVVLTRKAVRNDPSASDRLSRTILTNVRVLAINERLDQPRPARDGTSPSAADADAFKGEATATLELDPIQSEAIINAAALGRLSLVLRSAVDFTAAGRTRTDSANEAIRISSPFWTD